jgi:hypothetical protein
VLCCSALCCPVLCCSALCCSVLCCSVLCCSVLHRTVLPSNALCYAVLHRAAALCHASCTHSHHLPIPAPSPRPCPLNHPPSVRHFPLQETFAYYSKCTGHGSEAKAAAALKRYGPNKYEVPVPPFVELLKEHMVAPFFVFQIFCVLLWCLDEYWYYSLFTLFMLVAFECTVVSQRVRNLTELRRLTTPKLALNVYRNGK